MIKEPEFKFDGPIFHHYVVEHNGKEYKCNTLVYASYLAEKFNSKVWNVVLEKHIEPHIGLCGYFFVQNRSHHILITFHFFITINGSW